MFHYLFTPPISDFRRKDFSMYFLDTGNISSVPKHDLLYSLEHKK